MDKEQIAHDLALIAVNSRLDDHKAERGELGLNDYAEQMIEDYEYLLKKFEELLS